MNQLFNGMGGAEYTRIGARRDYTGEEKEEAGAVLYENTRLSRAAGSPCRRPSTADDVVFYEDGSDTSTRGGGARTSRPS